MSLAWITGKYLASQITWPGLFVFGPWAAAVVEPCRWRFGTPAKVCKHREKTGQASDASPRPLARQLVFVTTPLERGEIPVTEPEDVRPRPGGSGPDAGSKKLKAASGPHSGPASTPSMATPFISPEQFCERIFDYLVIGGGTAGLAVAARLSEDPGIHVGILEAGSATFDSPIISVPGRYGESLGTPYDWQYETLPQPGLGGRKLQWPRGKVLGGTSALNFMTWNRPNREDLDAWEELGNAGWGWDNFLPFYKRSENFIEPDAISRGKHEIHYDRKAFGTDGPLTITFSKEYSDSHQYWHKTLNELGVATNKAHLSGSNVGVWTNVVAVDPQTATRSFATSAYYLPNRHRSNLVVLPDAEVQEIILDRHEQAWITKGVRFKHKQDTYVASASREVIVSGGSVASPQLLELSGIGNPSLLERAGISVKVANPNVGENVQEHMMTATIFEIDPTISTPDDLRSDPVLAAAADELYKTTQGGPRTILPCAICYVPLSHFIPAEDLAALASRASRSTLQEEIIARRLLDDRRLGQVEYIFDVGNWSPFLTPSDSGKKYATMLQILQYPFSRGSVHISPDSPTGKPKIDPQYYGGKQGTLDLEIQLYCAEFGREIAETEPLGSFIKGRVWPPQELHGDSLKDWLVANTITDWHPVGTCAMGGTGGIKDGVVDERLRVYGVQGLRVVDASIMPLQISAHLQATVYAIAEKASQMILEDRLESK